MSAIDDLNLTKAKSSGITPSQLLYLELLAHRCVTMNVFSSSTTCAQHPRRIDDLYLLAEVAAPPQHRDGRPRKLLNK
jgi:hypothetical protein